MIGLLSGQMGPGLRQRQRDEAALATIASLVGAFVLAYGIALLIAVGRPSWRTPLLAVGALWYAVHALNHLLDIDEARSNGRGIADTVLLALGSAALAWLAAVSNRLERG